MESDPYIRELSDRIRAHPDDLTLHLRLGMAFFDRLRYKEALAHFQKTRQDENIRDQAMNLQQMAMEELKSI